MRFLQPDNNILGSCSGLPLPTGSPMQEFCAFFLWPLYKPLTDGICDNYKCRKSRFQTETSQCDTGYSKSKKVFIRQDRRQVFKTASRPFNRKKGLRNNRNLFSKTDKVHDESIALCPILSDLPGIYLAATLNYFGQLVPGFGTNSTRLQSGRDTG